MDLQQHYDSYLSSLREDALEGFEAYAKETPTQRPHLWSTAFHYISALVPEIKAAIAANNEQAYKRLLTQHRYAMLSLFDHMVGEVTWGIKGDLAFLLEITKGLKGRWEKFYDKNYVTFIVNNPPDRVVDWTQPLWS